jgi:hypothetical protein
MQGRERDLRQHGDGEGGGNVGVPRAEAQVFHQVVAHRVLEGEERRGAKGETLASDYKTRQKKL